LRWVRRLPALDTFATTESRVRCSVVIAARGEDARIEQTVRQLLAQRGVDLEVIVGDARRTRGRSVAAFAHPARGNPARRVGWS
jgi:hypothetical protein